MIREADGFSLLLALCVASILGCDSNHTQQVAPSLPVRDIQPETHAGDDTPVDTPAATKSLASGENVVSIHVKVTGLKNNSGKCRVAIYLGPEHFNDPSHAVAKESLDIVDQQVDWKLELKKPNASGTVGLDDAIAVSAYHDENDNARLDKNTFGIPTERYGFSNNPKRGLGPPKFQEVAVLTAEPIEADANKPTIEIEIALK